MDMDDLTPAGSIISLRRPVTGPHGRTVATFTPTVTPDPADLWEPFTRPTATTRGGVQRDPFGSYRPGRSIEHEPVDRAERDAQHTAQSSSHLVAAAQIRAALRGSVTSS